MFEVGDFVVYGSDGVYQVDQVGPLDISGIPADKIYYTLVSPYMKGSKIFSAVDNRKVVMRAVMKKDEALELIDSIKDIELLEINDDKKRNEVFKEALKTYDCKDLVRIIKTLYVRQEQKLAEGKKNTAGDEKYFHMAEERLYGELAISLDMEKAAVKEYVENRVAKLVSEA
ncbi:MAG: CarD family transcriptional regulator [Lachnospiraceae bacterium]|nr:CarD family transcriptional regulator [Lachnospiraceae bacterium]